MSAFKSWTTIFPGKCGLSWKLANNTFGTKEEAEALASKNCNVVAVPLQLYKHIKELEHKFVIADNILRSLHVTLIDSKFLD